MQNKAIFEVVKTHIDYFNKKHPDSKPAIVMGSNTYKTFLLETQDTLKSNGNDLIHEPISNYLDGDIYIIDRENYLNILKESDIVG